MKNILKEKLAKFQGLNNILMDIDDRHLTEVVSSDIHWRCGLSKEAAKKTDARM